MSNSPREIVDSYLTQGAYDCWQRLSAEALRELARFDSLQKKFSDLDRDVMLHIADDFAWLKKLSADYAAGMKLVQSGRPVSKVELDSVYEMYSLAAGLAEHDNDLIAQIVASGFVEAYARFPFQFIEHCEKQYVQSMKELKRQLLVARSLVREVVDQMAIDAALLVVTSMPSTGILVKLATHAASYVADELLGPDKAPLAETIDNANDIAGPVIDTIESMKRLSERTRQIAKRGGGVVVVVGFALHAHELRVAREICERLEKNIETAQRAFKALVKAVEKHKPELLKLRAAIQQAAKRVRDAKAMAIAIRDELHQLLRDNRYSNYVPKTWTIMAPASAAN
jgi:hypothetical protein